MKNTRLLLQRFTFRIRITSSFYFDLIVILVWVDGTWEILISGSLSCKFLVFNWSTIP